MNRAEDNCLGPFSRLPVVTFRVTRTAAPRVQPAVLMLAVKTLLLSGRRPLGITIGRLKPGLVRVS